jgi:hypothetical protein
LGLVETLYIVLFAWLAVVGPVPLSLDALGRRWSERGKSVCASDGLGRPREMAGVRGAA